MSSDFARSLSSKGPTITAEIMPPRGGDPSKCIAIAKRLQGLVNAINITDGSRAVMRMSSIAVSKLILDAGIEPIVQFACRDRNRIGIQADLLGAYALGIKNILCLTGDPVRVGDQPDAKSVHELDSIKLLQQIHSFNRSKDPVFNDLPDGKTNFFPGAAAYPNCKSINGLLRRLERKKNAGAKFLQTQMIMDPKVLEIFCKKISQPLDLPVLAGVFLLKSAKNALFINRVVPGACIPESIITRLNNAKDPAQEGLAIASEQAKQFLNITKGIHIMAIKAEDKIPEILDKASIKLLQL